MNIAVFFIGFLVLLVLLQVFKKSFFEHRATRVLSFVIFTAFFACFAFTYISFYGGSPLLPEHKNIVFEQKGVYAAYDDKQPVIFVKQPTSSGFDLGYLNENDTIKIQPIYGNIPGKIDKWLLESSVSSYPVRVNNKAINATRYNTINYQDNLTLISLMDSINLNIKIDSLDNERDIYILNHYTGSLNETDQVISSDTVYFPKVKDGIKLSRLFNQINKQREKKEQSKRKKKYNINDFLIDSYVKDNVLIARAKKVNNTNEINSNLFILQPYSSIHQFQSKKFTAIIQSSNKYNNLDSIPAQKTIDSILPTDNISIGYGLQTKFINLSKESDTIYGDKDIAGIYFKYPKRIQLPDSVVNKPFLITSWKGFINYDYIFNVDIAGNKMPFFAKANFNSDWKKVNINTGEELIPYSVNDNFYIDNGNEGVILSFSRNIQKIYGINIAYIIIGILIFFFLVLSFSWWKTNKPAENNAKLVWTSIILLLFFMAILKLIFSYRVASFPPENANFKEINLFGKSLIISVWALLGIPFLLAFLKWNFNKLYFIKNNSKNKWYLIVIVILLSTIVLIGAITSSQQSAFGLFRLNILSLIISFLGIYLFSPFINDTQNAKNVLWGIISYFSLIIIILVSNSLIIKDVGFLMLYSPVFLIIYPFMWLYWDSSLLINSNNIFLKKFVAPKTYYNKKWKKWFKRWNLAFIVGVILIILASIIVPKMSIFRDKLYRIEAGNPEFFLNRSVSEKTETFDMSLFKNNVYQMWQLQNYAANGGINGVGYAKSKIVNYGTTYPITLTDAFFSTYVLSEFGTFGGFTLLATFLILLMLLIWLATLLPQSLWKYFWVITSIGITLYYFANYMMLANIGDIYFTGQNIPFFSLNSTADLSYIIFVFILIGFSLNFNRNIPNFNYGISRFTGSKYRYLKNFIKVTVIITFVSFGYTSIKFLSIANNNTKKENFTLSNKFIRSFQNKIKGGKIYIKQKNKIDILKSAHFTEFEKAQIDLFNQRDSLSRYSINDGFLYLDKEGKLKINKQYFRLQSPFSSSYLWKGQLYSSNSDTLIKQLNFLTRTASAGFGNKDSLYTIKPDNRTQHISGYKRYNILNNENKTLFEIVFDTLTYLKPFDAGDNNVFVNGNPVNNKNSIIINNNDIVLIKKNNKKYYMILNNVKNNLISRLSWVNGKYKRLYRYGEAFPTAYVASKTADYVKINSKKDINLSINTDMQIKIQRIIRDFFNTQPNVTTYNSDKKNLHKAKNYSFTVMDTYSGEVLAMASWANYNPNNKEFYDYLYSISPYSQSKVLKDPNFKAHLIGSTFKPLAMAAMGLTFNNNNNYDIADLQVWHPEKALSNELLDRFNELKSNKRYSNYNEYTHPHHYISGISFDPADNITNNNTYNIHQFWDCHDNQNYREKWINSDRFIVKSLNYYMLSLFTIGLIDNNENIDKYLYDRNKLGKRLMIKFNDRTRKYFDISQSNKFSRNTMTLDPLSNTYIFSGLDSLFNVTINKDILYYKDTISDSYYKNIKHFINSFADNRKHFYLKNIIPDPVIFNADRPENIDYVETFARGGGNNKWNNIQLCESFARISTGNYVYANLERNNSENDSLSLPNKQWIQDHLIRSLHKVVTEGTASSLNRICSENQVYMIAKTGTLKEHGRKNENSGMLMFTIGKFNHDTHQFVKGKSYTCYLYLEEGSKYKFNLAKKLVTYLAKKINNDNPNEYIPYTPLPVRVQSNRPNYTNDDDNRISIALNNDNNPTPFYNYIDRITNNYDDRLEQICAVFDDVLPKWEYVNDPNSYDYFASASESFRFEFKGDCDDYAILMASAIRYIGGDSRVGTGCNENGCHAWAEVKIAKNKTELNSAINRIIRYYRKKGIRLEKKDIHTVKDSKGSYWTNLDWWGDKTHIGNTPYNVTYAYKYIK